MVFAHGSTPKEGTKLSSSEGENGALLEGGVLGGRGGGGLTGQIFYSRSHNVQRQEEVLARTTVRRGRGRGGEGEGGRHGGTEVGHGSWSPLSCTVPRTEAHACEGSSGGR